MSNSVQPHRRQPTRLPHPWDSPGKNAGVGCHFLLQCMKVKSLSCVRLLATPWTAGHQAPLSMGFSRQEYYMTQQSHYWAYTILKDTCTLLFIAAIFTIPRTWKQPRHLEEAVYIYTVEFFSAIKKNEFESVAVK